MNHSKTFGEFEVCEHCGQTTQYEEILCKGLVDVLSIIAQYIIKKGINAVHISKELEKIQLLTPTQGKVAHSLHWWGLIEPVVGNPGNWSLTQIGLCFLQNKVNIPHSLLLKKKTWNNQPIVISESEERLHITDIKNANVSYWEANTSRILGGNIIN
jgi:hypothetical protein